MTSLVDYLRDKLEAADNAPKIVRPGMIAQGKVEILLWPEEWRCRACGETGPRDEGLDGPWDHLRSHRPPRKKRWWRSL